MSRDFKFLIPCALAFLSAPAPAAKHPSMPEVLAASTPADWRLPDGDVYAQEVGFSDGLPVARSPTLHRTWLAHCYSMVGVGRDVAPRT